VSERAGGRERKGAAFFLFLPSVSSFSKRKQKNVTSCNEETEKKRFLVGVLLFLLVVSAT
jgi:hypothetical protein